VVRGEIANRTRRRWLHLTPTGETPDAPVAGPDHEARDVIARYYALLEQLGATERSIFVARTIEKLTLAEVAQIHGVSISTAQRRLTRATKRVAALVRRDPALLQLAGGGEA
jgi:RNA polymerase sigma factor (sigma-70 family)